MTENAKPPNDSTQRPPSEPATKKSSPRPAAVNLDEPPTPLDATAHLPKIIPFSTLSRCGGEVWIETNGQVYRLRKTRQGKLILTK